MPAGPFAPNLSARYMSLDFYHLAYNKEIVAFTVVMQVGEELLRICEKGDDCLEVRDRSYREDLRKEQFDLDSEMQKNQYSSQKLSFPASIALSSQQCAHPVLLRQFLNYEALASSSPNLKMFTFPRPSTQQIQSGNLLAQASSEKNKA